MHRHIIALLTITLTIGTTNGQAPDPRSVYDIFGQPQPHGEPIDKGFIGLYSGRTNLHFGQSMRVDLFAVNPTVDGPCIDLPLRAPLELTDAKGKPVPFRLEEIGCGGGNGLQTCWFSLWPTKDHAAGIFWKPGTYKLRVTIVIPKEQAPARKTLPGTFRSNELVFTVREPGAPLDSWDGKGKPLDFDPIFPYAPEDLFFYVSGLDDESSERLRKRAKWPKRQRSIAAAMCSPVTVPQDRKLTDVEVKKLIADLKHADPAVRVRAVRSVPPTAPTEVLAAATALLKDQYEEIAGLFPPSPTYPVADVAREALARIRLTLKKNPTPIDISK